MKITLGMNRISADELALMVGGRVEPQDRGDLEFGAVCTDSREADEDTLFCAIRGERVDGHNYISSSGCSVALCERVPDTCSSVCVVVDDVVSALGRFAAAYRRGESTRVIAVTGSVGKTTTKESIASAFGAGEIYKTEGNFNSVIGLPLSLLEIAEKTRFAVLEMGMSGFGEIESMSRAARPEIAVITNIGSSHLEMLGSRENIRRAKLEIVEGLREGGTLIINGDDPMLFGYDTGVKTLSVGIKNPNADFRALDIVELDDRTEFVFTDGKLRIPVIIPTLGSHNVLAALFALAVARLEGVDPTLAAEGLSRKAKVKLRQNIYEKNGITIIEDCYNASPESMRAALDVQKGIVSRRGGRAVALLGDMLELGENSPELHFEVGRYAAECGVDRLITVGPLSLKISEGAALDGTVSFTDPSNKESVAAHLIETLRDGDVLLVKASRGLSLEKVTEILNERM